MPRYYSKYLGKTLRDKLEEFLSIPHEEQLSLYDELAVSRETLLQALKLYESAFNLPDSDNGKVKDTIALATVNLQSNLDHVRDMCLAASRVERESADKVSLGALNVFVMQIIRAVYKACPDEAQARKIEEQIHETVRFKKEDEAVELTPSDVVREMISTVPKDDAD